MEMIESIDRFINYRMYSYAMLINGKWGSGKTYFVKEVLLDHIRSLNRDVYYLSLYGITTTDEISQQLCVQAIKDRTPRFAKKAIDSKGGQVTTKVLSAMLKGGMNYIGAGETEIERVVQNLPDFNNSVIIFDDVERCCCSINEVLGYINNYVEHSGTSVILVANEEEIDRWQFDRNTEIQTLVAMDSRVEVDIPQTFEDTIRYAAGKEKKEKISYTPEEIEYRRKVIFHSDEGYKTIKEKVIGLTINFEPDLKPIFKTLIEKKINPGMLQQELLENVGWLVDIAHKNRHNNLRTFQYFLEKITTIFNIIENHYPVLRQSIWKYTFRSTVRYMKGLAMPEWDGDYGNQVFEEPSFLNQNQELGFRFIDNLILNNEIDEEYVHEVLARVSNILEKKGQLGNDPYNLISEWWLAEDDELYGWLDVIESNIINGKYSTELYTELIRRIAEMITHNILKEKCKKIFDAMKVHIQKTDFSELEALDSERFLLEGEAGKLYRSMYEEIKVLMDAAIAESEKQKYNDAIESKDLWATNLVELSSNNGNVEGHSFIYWLDPDMVLNLISGSTNKQLYQFRNALYCVYGEHVYYENKHDDYAHLQYIKECVESMDTVTWGEVKKAYKNWIYNDLKRYLEKVYPDKEDSI